jgi:tetratricopeptide (TPR) repeat protein
VDTKQAAVVKQDKEEPKSLSKKISDFIQRYRVIFIAAVSSIVVVLLCIGLYTSITNTISERSSRAMETVRTKIATWGNETDDVKKTDLENEIQAELDTVIKKWPKSFAASQALYTKAGLSALKQDWEKAEFWSLEATKINAKSYLAPIALESAAVAAEEQGKPDIALEYYLKIISNYSSDTPNLPHAHFSAARLYEGKAEWKNALENYNKLISDFSNSDWALLAKNRVVYLKSLGYDL